VLIPVAIEALWAAVWIPRAWRNAQVPEEDAFGRPAGVGAVMLGLVLVCYHWPILLACLWWRGRERLPFWLIVVVMIVTAGMYTGLLLWWIGAGSTGGN
jgi:hypothetical protein